MGRKGETTWRYEALGPWRGGLERDCGVHEKERKREGGRERRRGACVCVRVGGGGWGINNTGLKGRRRISFELF